MASASAALPSLEGYQLRLPAFAGPLDVLLRLIERDQLAISEISLLAVFDQFLAYVDALESPVPGVIADFVAVAGRLSVLKSRALLPRPAKTVEEPDELDLVRQLEEYRAVKAAAALLDDLQRTGSGAFGRGEGVARPAAEPSRVAPRPSSALAKAVSRWLTRLPAKPVHLPPFRVVSMREMIARINSALGHDRQISFDSIRATCSCPQDTAVAFLALLTLMRRQAIVATQTELFGSIILAREACDPLAKRQWPPSESNGTNGHGRTYS